ncbi:MAG: zf-HC2 domain-containing protein, partial [Deltaproteobacteria bacterium]
MTDCDRTPLYFDGELSPGDEPAVLDHLAGCTRCQAELGDWMGIEVALSRSRAAAGVTEARTRRRVRWSIGAGVAAAAAAAAIAVLVLRGQPAPSPIALAETRSLEARVTASAFDRHRPYRVERGAPAREVLPLGVLVDLERRGDSAGLVAAHLLAGDLARAGGVLDALPASPQRDSDRAAAALAAGDPLAALAQADAAIAVDPALAPALWNRALALDALELPMVAAAALDDVAARGEPGWSDEARSRAAALRVPFAVRARELAAYRAAATAMLGGGPVLDAALARRHPGLARRDLYRALAAAGSSEEVHALAPLAIALEQAAGDDRLRNMVRGSERRDFAVRRGLGDRYRALIAGKLDRAAQDALVADLDRAGPAVTDLLVGALLEAPPTAATVVRLRRAAATGDAWIAVEAARRDAVLRRAAGDTT